MAGHFIPSASNRKQEMIRFIKKYIPVQIPEDGGDKASEGTLRSMDRVLGMGEMV